MTEWLSLLTFFTLEIWKYKTAVIKQHRGWSVVQWLRSWVPNVGNFQIQSSVRELVPRCQAKCLHATTKIPHPHWRSWVCHNYDLEQMWANKYALNGTETHTLKKVCISCQEVRVEGWDESRNAWISRAVLAVQSQDHPLRDLKCQRKVRQPLCPTSRHTEWRNL